MKVTFVYTEDESLGLQYLSGILKKHGHQTELIFDPALFNDNILPIKPLSKFFNFEDQIVEDIIDSKPDIIGFSLLTDIYPWFRRIASKIKKMTNIPIVVGGIHATSVPDIVIQENFVDFLIVGEGEFPLLELINRLEGDRDFEMVPSLWYKKNDEVKRTAILPKITNLDEIPVPDKDLFYDKAPMFQKNYFIEAARGCVFKCTFCHHSISKDIPQTKRSYRMRSVKSVIDELKMAKQKYNIHSVYFTDELFALDMDWMREFVPAYREQVGLPYSCSVYPSMMDEERVILLKNSFCFGVEMGVQTINTDLKKQLNRFETNARVEKIIGLLKKHGIRVYTQNIMALPGEREEHLKEMLEFYTRVKPTVSFFFWLRYYPRTAVVSDALKMGILTQDQVLQIEKGEITGGINTGGTFLGKYADKYFLVLNLSKYLPLGFVRFLIHRNLIRFIPVLPLRSINMVFIFFAQRFTEFLPSKYGSKIYRFNRDIARYQHYIFRKIFSLGRKKRNNPETKISEMNTLLEPKVYVGPPENILRVKA
ncbi:MAG: radical SAM protein [Candidatus Omnitrophota bacterium]